MSYLSVIGKTLDQPLLISRLSNTLPVLLTTGAAAYTLYDVYKAPEKKKKHTLIKNLFVLGFTVGSALLATRGLKPVKIFGKQIIKGFNGLIDIAGPHEVIKNQTKLIDNFLKNNQVNAKVMSVLNKAKSKILNLSDLKVIMKDLGQTGAGKSFLNHLIPAPEYVTSGKIFSEIGRLSLIGLIPVAGGITGGIVGDSLTEKHWKKRIPDKIKEGIYQYLANIFLCNVGAGGALAIMEKFNVKSTSARVGGMVTGIILTGVLGGSVIANYICNKFINPLLDSQNNKHNPQEKRGIYSERKPEAIDIGLHADDMATIGVMSGLRWIEPALPILYSISGYRAGIGYRNGEFKHKRYRQKTEEHNVIVNRYRGDFNEFSEFRNRCSGLCSKQQA